VTAVRTAEVDGQTVPLADCVWVLWLPCGCPRGVTVARSAPTEDDAWKAFYDGRGRWQEIAHAIRRGERMELMTHARYSAEVYERMLARCPHQGSAA
jgi:hypothetical protein